jgi:hypothetical protein
MIVQGGCKMLDDLRNSSSFIDEEEDAVEEGFDNQRSYRKQKKVLFLGMTAQQRFIISLMIFMMICVLGSFAMVLSGSVVLPF